MELTDAKEIIDKLDLDFFEMGVVRIGISNPDNQMNDYLLDLSILDADREDEIMAYLKRHIQSLGKTEGLLYNIKISYSSGIDFQCIGLLNRNRLSPYQLGKGTANLFAFYDGCPEGSHPFVISCRHTTDHLHNCIIYRPINSISDGFSQKLKIFDYDEVSDLGIYLPYPEIQTSQLNLQKVKICNNIEDKLNSIVFQSGKESSKEGKIISFHNKITKLNRLLSNLIITSNISKSGDSGSPVLTENYELIGLIIGQESIRDPNTDQLIEYRSISNYGDSIDQAVKKFFNIDSITYKIETS